MAEKKHPARSSSFLRDTSHVIVDFGAGAVDQMQQAIGKVTSDDALFVAVRAQNANIVNWNNKCYPFDSMREAIGFVRPNSVPVTVNHANAAGGGLISMVPMGDPIGRVRSARTLPRSSEEVRPYSKAIVDAMNVHAAEFLLRVTDQDAISKIMDGRYFTLSTGVYPFLVTCSICKQPFIPKVNNEVCEHMPGEMYEDSLAYSVYNRYLFTDISFVTFPADMVTEVVGVSAGSPPDHWQMAHADFFVVNPEKDRIYDPKVGCSSMWDSLDSMEGSWFVAPPQKPAIKPPTSSNADNSVPNREEGDLEEPEAVAMSEKDKNDQATGPEGDQTQHELDEARTQITDLKGQVAQLTDECATARGKIGELESSLEESLTKQTEVGQSLDKEKREVARLGDRVGHQDRALDEAVARHVSGMGQYQEVLIRYLFDMRKQASTGIELQAFSESMKERTIDSLRDAIADERNRDTSSSIVVGDPTIPAKSDDDASPLPAYVSNSEQIRLLLDQAK